MIDLLSASILGILSGILIGLLPSLSATIFLITFYPLFLEKSLLFCLMFYSVAISTSQYFGSVTTLSFGVPGENTSLPLLSIRSKLIDDLKEMHFLCSLGSFIASLSTIVLLILSIKYVNEFAFYIKSYFSLACAAIGLILCIKYSENRPIDSLLLLLFGWFVGKIGYSQLSNDTFFTFDNAYLYGGIPVLPAILGIYAAPNILKLFWSLNSFPEQNKTKMNTFRAIHSSLVMAPVILRSSIIGLVAGIIPYIGNSMSSYLAFLVEKKIRKDNYKAQAVAAESANNSANISVLLPLLLLGVAIVPSEFVLLEIINSSNVIISWKDFFINLHLFFIFLVFANAISFILSWNLVELIISFMQTTKRYFPFLLLALIMLSIYQFGVNYSQEKYYITVFIIFSVFGFIMKDNDLMPFVYGFLLQNNVEEIAYRVYNIYLS